MSGLLNFEEEFDSLHRHLQEKHGLRIGVPHERMFLLFPDACRDWLLKYYTLSSAASFDEVFGARHDKLVGT